MTETVNAVPARFRPRLTNGNCTWNVFSELRENEGLLTLGLLQAQLPLARQCLVDLSEVTWADPLPLLTLGLLLAESGLGKQAITIDLGDLENSQTSAAHRSLLKFIARQGFLTALARYATIRFYGDAYSDVDGLRLHLANEHEAGERPNRDCIHATLIRADELAVNVASLQSAVEQLVKEAQDRTLGVRMATRPLARDMLLQKLRKLLYELLLNVGEHSHAPGQPAYAGVYARVRGAKPPTELAAKRWELQHARTLSIWGQSTFHPDPFAEWLELYLCDVGVGLTARIQDWSIPEDPDAAAALRKAQRAKRNPLQSIASLLFRIPFSCHMRYAMHRTAVTGLQHLGHLLQVGGDHARIYTQNGCWVGDHFPWTKHYSRKFLGLGEEDVPGANVKRKGEQWAYAELQPVSGTAFAFSIQPREISSLDALQDAIRPDDQARNRIIGALASTVSFDPPIFMAIADRRTEDRCEPRLDELPADGPTLVVVRPPRLTSKQDIGKWLDLAAGTLREPPQRPIHTLVFAELTPFQTLTFRELLTNVTVHDRSELEVILIAEDWSVCCLTTSAGERQLHSNPRRATAFMAADIPDGTFSLPLLAIMLREMDSELFWKNGMGGAPDPFFQGPVEWTSKREQSHVVRLDRYLDFPHALADPRRYRACRRALRRCLALYPLHEIVAADRLVDTLVHDATQGLYANKASSGQRLVVGSIAVTSHTAADLLEGAADACLHVMVHADANPLPTVCGIATLLWWSQLKDGELEGGDLEQPNHLPWRRIPHTPYIAPRGEHAASLLRYRRLDDGSLDFDEPLFYGRTPRQMYEDFQRLGVLKVGHWRCGSQHDLQTINLRLAFAFSFLERGPLYQWLREQFNDLFAAEKGVAKAQLLVYPSHPVTDLMLDRIRQDPGFKGLLPSGGAVPVKFIGAHSETPLLAAHLVAHRIDRYVREHGWQQWSAVVLDDAIVSGRHMRELTQFLQGLGASAVHTIALLERTGSPSDERVVPRFARHHRRFWRWDVPILGRRGDCALCQALTVARSLSGLIRSHRQSERLKEWLQLWAVRDVDTAWHNSGLDPKVFVTPVHTTFGVSTAANGKSARCELKSSNSTSATSVALELTRLLARADVAMSKARELLLQDRANVDASIEMIASQLLLYLDDLTVAERRERFLWLLETLWDLTTITPATSLGALCFTLADEDVTEWLWRECESRLLRERHVHNLDAILAANIIDLMRKSAGGDSYQLTTQSNLSEQHNAFMLGMQSQVHSAVRRFLSYCRNPSEPGRASIHNTEVKGFIADLTQTEIRATPTILRQRLEALLGEVQEISGLSSSLQQACIIRPATMREADEQLRQHASALRLCLSAGMSELLTDDAAYQALDSQLRELRALLFGDSTRKGCLTVMGDQFIQYFASGNEFDQRFIRPLVRSLREGWGEVCAAKIAHTGNELAAEYWRANAGDAPMLPEVLCSSSVSCEQLWLYCDSSVRYSIGDVLANVFHARRLIEDPWVPPGDCEKNPVTAHLWWRVQMQESFAIFETANDSPNQKIQLKHTVNIAGLERAGGRIEVRLQPHESLVERRTAFVKLFIPSHLVYLKAI